MLLRNYEKFRISFNFMPNLARFVLISCIMAIDTVKCEQLKAIVASISEYCHVLGQPSTMILSSIELLRMPSIDEETRKLAYDTCYEAALEIKNVLFEMKRKCDSAEQSVTP